MKDYKLPFQDLNSFVPSNLRTNELTSFMSNLFNKQMTKDESEPLFGYVGNPILNMSSTQKVPHSDLSREVNALIPVINFKVGSEDFNFTPDDIIQKCQVLGVSTNQNQWLYSQGNNYAPPIDFDKFTNFFNYYWIGSALYNKPTLTWNPEITPEYYTIQKPVDSSIDKSNVKVASTSTLVLTGSGFFQQVFTVEFITNTLFKVTTSGGGNFVPLTQNFNLTGNETNVSFFVNPGNKKLISFTILRDDILDVNGNVVGIESFNPGDKFIINGTFLTNINSVTFQGSSGIKGKITNVSLLSEYQSIDGILLKEDDRVLVKNNTNNENGIYVVKPGNWIRSTDNQTILTGSRVFVIDGNTNKNKLFVSNSQNLWSIQGITNNTSDWQEGNFWVSSQELQNYKIDSRKIIQATRPIIEFENGVELNTNVLNNKPCGINTGVYFIQRKTDINQLPLFNTYLYDGTHSGKVSPIFMYEEDSRSSIDLVLQKRLKHSTNLSNDFIFSHALSQDGISYFYKKNNSLKSIWSPGITSSQILQTQFSGDGNGVFSITNISDFNSTQIWTIKAISATTFSITGSKTGEIGIAEIGSQFTSVYFNLIITQGTTQFSIGDTYKVLLVGVERVEFFNENKQSVLTGDGVWGTPRMFFENVKAEPNGSLSEGNLYAHFRNILDNKLTEVNHSVGGNIKLWSEQFNLLTSLLIQKDVSPISIIDTAQLQYENGLNFFIDSFYSELIDYINTTPISNNSISRLAHLYDVIYSKFLKSPLSKITFDSTCKTIPTFPATLPILGILEPVQPNYIFENDLGKNLIQHHDGHLSPLNEMTLEFVDKFFTGKTTVTRSDGTIEPIVSSTIPSNPFKGQLIFNDEFYIFDVISEESIEPTQKSIGDKWYSRTTQTLKEWSGTTWNTISKDLGWVEFNPAIYLNEFILLIENKLYQSTNLNHKFVFSQEEMKTSIYENPSLMKDELYQWAALNKYNPIGSDFDSSDAFTWNYSFSISHPPVSGSVPARWFNYLKAHQSSVLGVIPTSRPNIEPWKLVGNVTKPSNWDTLWKQPFTPNDLSLSPGVISTVKAVKTTPTTLYQGLIVVDGVQLNTGDKILLTNETSPSNNGIWIVSSGLWDKSARTSTSFTSEVFQYGLVNIESGDNFSDTVWVLLNQPVTFSDNQQFSQVKFWKDSMWTYISGLKPTLKLSVDTYREALLPPYVNSSLPYSSKALTNVIPPKTSFEYVYGQNSPVEAVWKNTIDFFYSVLKTEFRKDPLGWIGRLWGFEWVSIDNIPFDLFNNSIPQTGNIKLHGDSINLVTRQNPSITNISGNLDFDLIRESFTTSNKQSFSMYVDGVKVGNLLEGQTHSVSFNSASFNILIEDGGIAFRVGDKFSVSLNNNSATIVFKPTTTFVSNGLNQIFVNCLRQLSIDNSINYSRIAFNDWDVKLGYRVGGFLVTDDLKIQSILGNLEGDNFKVFVKKNEYVKDLWIQSLRITVIRKGNSVLGKSGLTIPSTTADDWVFQIEGYNPQKSSISIYQFDDSVYETFSVLTGENTNLEWKRKIQKTNLVNINLPLIVTGLQNVIDIIFGYSEYLSENGWRLSNTNSSINIDAESKRINDYQLAVEKLVNSIYLGVDINEGEIINPFMNIVWNESDTGLVSSFKENNLFDIHSNSSAFDLLGDKISSNDLTIIRNSNTTQIESKVPMFSIHCFNEQYEHILIFNNLLNPSLNQGVIFDSFSGARLNGLFFNGRRQSVKNFRPEFGGYYLVGNEVKRNITNSIDSLGELYNPDSAFDNTLLSEHSLALLGYSKKSYLENLGVSDKTQFNFWRGLIQSKGTNASIGAFLNNDHFLGADVDEFWAYKVAEYGDARQKTYPELKINPENCLQQFTKLIFNPDSIPSGFENFDIITTGNETQWYSFDDLNAETSFNSKIKNTFSKVVVNGEYVSFENSGDVKISGVTFEWINSSLVKVTQNGTINVTVYGVDIDKYNPLKLINYVDKTVASDIVYWNPLSNVHNPEGVVGVNITSSFDQAKYNKTLQVTENKNYDLLKPWGENEVGRVWWNTSNLSYVPYLDKILYPKVEDRLNRWGALTEYASVDVFEWVKSDTPPEKYGSGLNGEVAISNTYERNRTWSVRPIAWSHSGVPISSAHPSFNGSFNSNLTIDFNNGIAYLESGQFSDFGISTGYHFGAWIQDTVSTKPMSEYKIINSDLIRTIDLTTQLPPTTFFETLNSVDYEIDVVTSFNNVYGNLVLSTKPSITTQLRDLNGDLVNQFETTNFLVCESIDSNISDLYTIIGGDFTFSVDDSFSIQFPLIGITVIIKFKTDGVETLENIFNLIASTLANKLYIQDAVSIQEICPLVDEDGLVQNVNSYSNNGTSLTDVNADPLYITNNGVGWRAWSIPSQAELSNDTIYPNSSWKPYFGDWKSLDSIAPIDTILSAVSNDNLILNDGTTINQYTTSWTGWGKITDTKINIIHSTNDTQASISIPDISYSGVSVFINGYVTFDFNITGNVVLVNNVSKGEYITVLLRGFNPSKEQLAFDPEVKDNLLIQKQYKLGYDYVQTPVRNKDGAILTNSYYFWVKNKSSIVTGGTKSIKTITENIIRGPDNFSIFHNFDDETEVFNAVTISNLNLIVGKNDTYKLRIVRDYTLRDDSNELDLKNTHTEWELIRKNQRLKIPEKLWLKIIDSMCGQDVAGNSIPSVKFLSYDSRNGTSTRYGFKEGQILADSNLLIDSVTNIILNTKLTDPSGSSNAPFYIQSLDFSDYENWFSSNENIRKTMTLIWNTAEPKQINEVFFSVLEDVLANNLEITDIFKTSRLSVNGIKVLVQSV